jgi:hypothetical protein
VGDGNPFAANSLPSTVVGEARRERPPAAFAAGRRRRCPVRASPPTSTDRGTPLPPLLSIFFPASVLPLLLIRFSSCLDLWGSLHTEPPPTALTAAGQAVADPRRRQLLASPRSPRARAHLRGRRLLTSPRIPKKPAFGESRSSADAGYCLDYWPPQESSSWWWREAASAASSLGT